MHSNGLLARLICVPRREREPIVSLVITTPLIDDAASHAAHPGALPMVPVMSLPKPMPGAHPSTYPGASALVTRLAGLGGVGRAGLLPGQAATMVPEGFFSIDPSITFLNHGSYGSTPKAAQRHQALIRERVERDPVRFYKVDLETLLDGVRETLAGFLNCRAADLALLSNATYGLCTILHSLDLQPGDEVLVTDHEYQSLYNELERLCARTGAVVVKAPVPFPVQSPEQVTESFLSRVTSKTKVGFISHITSSSSLIFPVAPIVRAFNAKGIDIVVDGAHSPGHVPVDLRGLNPSYFVGSGHKWLNGPKGSGFVYVRPDKQATFRPVALSSRAHKVRPDRPLFLRDFDYLGTDDYSGVLSLPTAMEATATLLPGGFPALMKYNHELVLEGRRILCEALGLEATAPESMVCGMATLVIPEPAPELANRPTAYDDALQDALYHNHRVVVPIWRLNATNQRLVRISAHVYNTPEDYRRLAEALRVELALEHRTRVSRRA